MVKQTENVTLDGEIKSSNDKDPAHSQTEEEVAAWVVDQWIVTLQQAKLNQKGLILAVSCLLYSIGASLEGFTGIGPSPEEVLKDYYVNPKRLGVAMMAQALQMNQTWLESLDQITKEH